MTPNTKHFPDRYASFINLAMEQIEALGELGYMVKTYCSSAGHWALEDLYGDGSDLAELYLAKHPDTGTEVIPN